MQAEQAYAMAAGRTERLLLYAGFLKPSAGRPGREVQGLDTSLEPLEQARILAAGLSEPARRVLTALNTFGAGLTPDYYAVVTGLPAESASGASLADAGRELIDAGLVTRMDPGYPGAMAGSGASAVNIAYHHSGCR